MNTWITSIRELIQKNDAKEAYALAEYFPLTVERTVCQIIALLKMNQLRKADSLVKNLGAKAKDTISTFASTAITTDINVLDTALQALDNHKLSLSYFCLETSLFIHPHATADVINMMCRLISTLFQQGHFKVGIMLCRRIVLIDHMLEPFRPILDRLERKLFFQSNIQTHIPERIHNMPSLSSHSTLSSHTTGQSRKGPFRVLCIDDSSVVQKLVTMILAAEGFKVTTASDGLDGIKKAQELQPDMILLDFLMPKMNGFQVCRILQKDKKLRHIPVMLVVSKGDNVGDKFVARLGVTGYITKPFHPEELVSKTRQILQGQERPQEITFAQPATPDAPATPVAPATPAAPAAPATPTASAAQPAPSISPNNMDDDFGRLLAEELDGVFRDLNDEIPKNVTGNILKRTLRRIDAGLPLEEDEDEFYEEAEIIEIDDSELESIDEAEEAPAPPEEQMRMLEGGGMPPSSSMSLDEQMRQMEKEENRFDSHLELTSHKLTRHTRIEFPSKCQLEQKVELRIQLTKEIPPTTRVLQKMTIDVEKPAEPILLDVHVTAPTFAIQPRRQSLRVQIDRDSEMATFLLFPLELGKQTLEIEFFHQSLRVGYLLVTTTVSQDASSEEPLHVSSMEDPMDTLQNVSRFTPVEKYIVHVSWIERLGKLLYTIYASDPDEYGEWETSSPTLKDDIEEYLRELNAFLADIVVQGNPQEALWESMCFNLQSLGEHLFNTLIPSQVIERATTWKQGTTVIISTNEQWIPWELMFDGQDFWGKKFILARYPRLSDRHDHAEENRPRTHRTKELLSMVNVVGGGIPQAEAHRVHDFFNQFSSSLIVVKNLEHEPVVNLEKSLTGTELLHFTCHGHLEPHLLQIAQDKSRIQNLLPQTISKLSLEPGCFVFANACSSTVPVVTFGRFHSFGWEFYRRGAGIFIGTLGAIPIKYAIPFAESIYQALFSSKTIGQAVAIAKEKAEKERNLFWLLYTIYGNPDLCLQISGR
ncbi:MAG: response regulator [bacterium]|nr:response regulator [bacterium]